MSAVLEQVRGMGPSGHIASFCSEEGHLIRGNRIMEGDIGMFLTSFVVI